MNEQDALPGLASETDNVVDFRPKDPAEYAEAAAKGGRPEPYGSRRPSESAIEQGHAPEIGDLEKVPDPDGERNDARAGHPSVGGANKGRPNLSVVTDDKERAHDWAISPKEKEAAQAGIPLARDALHGPSTGTKDEETPKISVENRQLADEGIAARRVLGATRRRIDDQQ